MGARGPAEGLREGIARFQTRELARGQPLLPSYEEVPERPPQGYLEVVRRSPEWGKAAMAFGRLLGHGTVRRVLG